MIQDFLFYLASPSGFEPPTPRLGGECSIQLSYEDTGLLYHLIKKKDRLNYQIYSVLKALGMDFFTSFCL